MKKSRGLRDRIFGLRLPMSLYKEIKAIADRNEVSVAQVIRVFIEQGLQNNK